MKTSTDTNIEKLRRSAKKLAKTYSEGDPKSIVRLKQHPPKSMDSPLKHADFLNVIARENSFASWPQLKADAEITGYSRAQKQQRLKIALFHGQNALVERLLLDDPDLSEGFLGLQIALFDLGAVRQALQTDATAAIAPLGPRRPILHLSYSQYLRAHPELKEDMLEIAQLFVAHGADVNDYMTQGEGPLSALYGALGHAGNLSLAAFLLEHGANPNDGESLYHATELGHREGVRLLLKHGAKVAGTNAVLRAMDFDDVEMVSMLLDAGGREAEELDEALFHGGKRICSPAMVRLLLQAGANPLAERFGRTAHSYAQIYGNFDYAKELPSQSGKVDAEDRLLIQLARGEQGCFETAPELSGLDTLIGDLISHSSRLGHIENLIDAGLSPDRPDDMGVTPLQSAGWEGLPKTLTFFLSKKPDFTHVNGFGGDLISTILHGADNCPNRENRDHLTCAKLALEAGAPLLDHYVKQTNSPAFISLFEAYAQTD